MTVAILGNYIVPTMPDPAPIPLDRRIEGLDVIRGFALLGTDAAEFGAPVTDWRARGALREQSITGVHRIPHS